MSLATDGRLLRATVRSFILAAAISFLPAGVICAADFSADIVGIEEARGYAGKAYAANGRYRIERDDAITIVSTETGSSWLYVPSQNIVIEQPIDRAKLLWLIPQLPDEAKREMVGTEIVEGRACNKYKITYSLKGRREEAYRCVDPQTGIPVKTSGPEGSWSVILRNIVIGPQNESLFTPPRTDSRRAVADVPKGGVSAENDGAPAANVERDEY